MAFESVRITSLRNGVSAVIGAREDLAQADVVTLALTDNTGVSSYRWEIVGRPEYSTAGGAGGPNPWLLGTGATASFTVDSDSGSVHLDGAYIARCIVNIDTPTETRITTELARKTALTIPALGGGTRSLRKLGQFESLEDLISIANVVAGWATMMNRWLEYLTGVGGGGGGFPGYGVVGNISQIDVGDTASAGALATVARADHQHALPVPTVINDVAATSALGSSAKVAREDHSHKGVHSVNGLFGDVVTDTFPGYGSAGNLSQIDVGDGAAAGVLTTVARADHQHPLLVPTVVTAVAAASALGSSAKVAREDHAHQGVHSVNGLFGDITLPDTFPGYGLVGSVSQIDVGDTASAGALNLVARIDHQHALPVPTVINDVAATSALGSSAKVAREDHSHKGVHSVNGLFGDVTVSEGDPFPGYGSAGNLSTIDIGDTASAGVLTTVARADHQHPFPAPTVINDVGAASALGSGTKAAREDHAHKGVHSVNGLFGDVTIASSFPGYGVAGDLSSIDVGDAAAGGGLAVVARADHQHPLAAPTVINPIAAASALGSSAKVAREDHTHAGVHTVNGLSGDVTISVSSFPGYGVVGNITAIDIGDAASAGVLTTVARADHQHGMAASIVSVDILGSASSVGSSPRAAREDHSHRGVHSVNGLFGDVVIPTGSAAADGYWFIDQDAIFDTAASDVNVGFVAAAKGATFNPATTNHGVALRTWEEFFIRCPKQGNGHSIVILVAPRASGAVYRNKANSADEAMNFSGFSGYSIMRRGSNLTNDADDKCKNGAMQAVVGPVGDGYFTLAGGGTTTSFSVSSGSLGGTNACRKFRGRFSPTTPTVALRNTCFLVYSNTGTGLVPGTALVATPQAGEQVYIERPGVRAGTFHEVDTDVGVDSNMVAGGVSGQVTTVGFGWSTPVLQLGVVIGSAGGTSVYAFCEVYNSSGNNVQLLPKDAINAISIGRTYTDETNASRDVGLGFHSASSCQFFASLSLVGLNSYVQSSGFFNCRVTSGSAIGGGGSLFLAGTNVQAFFTAVASSGSSVFGSPYSIPGALVQQPTRIESSLIVRGHCSVINVDVTGAAGPVLGEGASLFFGSERFHGSNIYVKQLIGALASGYVIDFDNTANPNNATQRCQDTDILIDSTTVTALGAAGDIRFAGGAQTQFSDLLVANVIDHQRNQVRGDANSRFGQAVLGTNLNGSSISAGMPISVFGVAGGVVQSDLAAGFGNNARIDGYAVTSAANGNPIYWVPAEGACPANALEAPVDGDLYLSTTPGRLSKIPSAVRAGRYANLIQAGSGNFYVTVIANVQWDPFTLALRNNEGAIPKGAQVRIDTGASGFVRAGGNQIGSAKGWCGVTLKASVLDEIILVKWAGVVDVLVNGAIVEGWDLFLDRLNAGLATTETIRGQDSNADFPIGYIIPGVSALGGGSARALIIPKTFTPVEPQDVVTISQ